MNLSVIIPVYNQEKIILKTLNSLLNQSISQDDYEIIVVDDGSTDKTEKILWSVKKKTKNRLIILKTTKSHGKGAARNLGIKNARNKIIVSVDGDILVSQNFLFEHLKWHKKFSKENFSMIGYTTWWPKLKITPFMYWLEHGGKQLDFDNLKNVDEIDYRHFYTGNASFKRNFLLKNGLFDEGFGREMYEDLELAYRLQKKGLRIFYNKNAIGYHYHPTDLQKYSKRMLKVGKGAKILFQKHPELEDKVAFSRFTFRIILNQIFSPIYFIIGKVFKSLKWMGYYYNAKFFKIYMKGYENYD